MPVETLHIHLLGAFRLLHNDEAVKGFEQARLQELLAYLLLHRDIPVSRQQLAFLFWPDSSEDQARTNFRNLWHRLRRALPDADRFLRTDELTVQWRWTSTSGAPSCANQPADLDCMHGRSGKPDLLLRHQWWIVRLTRRCSRRASPAAERQG